MGFDNTEEIGIDAVKSVINSFGWIFREITKRDIGIDAFAETPEGHFIYFQIKTGHSHFHIGPENLTYYFNERHFNYWKNLKAPVLIIGYLPKLKKCYYIKFENTVIFKNQEKI